MATEALGMAALYSNSSARNTMPAFTRANSSKVSADRAGVDAVAEDDVDAEIFHRRVDKLFDDARHPVDFVDEQDAAVFQIRQERQHICGL